MTTSGATPLYDELAHICRPCIDEDHEGCTGTVLVKDQFEDGGRQYAACGCTCGGGLEAWRELGQ